MATVPRLGGGHGPEVTPAAFPPAGVTSTPASEYAERVRQCVALLTEQIDDLLRLLLLSVAPGVQDSPGRDAAGIPSP